MSNETKDLGPLTLGELSLIHQGLAVLGEEDRVDHKLVDAWRALLGRVGTAAESLANQTLLRRAPRVRGKR